MKITPTVSTAPPKPNLTPKSCRSGACAVISCARIVSLAE